MLFVSVCVRAYDTALPILCVHNKKCNRELNSVKNQRATNIIPTFYFNDNFDDEIIYNTVHCAVVTNVYDVIIIKMIMIMI